MTKRGEYKTKSVGGRRRSSSFVPSLFGNGASNQTDDEAVAGSPKARGSINTAPMSTALDMNNISALAQSSMQTIKKGVTQVTTTIGESIAKIEQSNISSWTSSVHKPSWTPEKRTSGAFGFTNAARRNRELEQTLNNMPQGDIADTILVTTVSDA